MNAFAVRPSSGPRPWLLIEFEGTFEHPYREFASKEAAETAAQELNEWLSDTTYNLEPHDHPQTRRPHL